MSLAFLDDLLSRVIVTVVVAGFAALAYLLRSSTTQRLSAAEGTPEPGTPVVPEPELRTRLHAMSGDNGPITVRDEGATIVIAWQLMGIPWATYLFRRKLRETHALHLTVEGTVVAARLRAGKVAWESAAATWMPRAVVTWKTKWSSNFGVARERPMPIGEDGPRTPSQLVAHVRAVVVGAGYVFEPRVRG